MRVFVHSNGVDFVKVRAREVLTLNVLQFNDMWEELV